MFIDILSKVLYIFGRGQAVSKCLYAIDETNYYIGRFQSEKYFRV